MEAIIGLVLIYAWVHAMIVVTTKIQNTNTYENVVLIVAAVGFVLYVIGTI